MGYGIVKKCALDKKMKVCIADINQAGMDKKKAELVSMGASAGDLMTAICDVRKVEDYEALCKKVYDAWGECAYLHLNAGMSSGSSAYKTPLPEWKLCLDIDLYGVINGLHVFTPKMVAQKADGMILATSSLSGIMNSAAETGIPYVVAKHGVTLTMEYLQHELRSKDETKHVTAHILHPGLIRTNIASNSAAQIAELDLDRETRMQTPSAMSDGEKTKFEEISYSPEQLADGLFKRLENGDFYCIVSPTIMPENLFKGLTGMRAEDIMYNRQPLSVLIPEEKSRTRARLKELREMSPEVPKEPYVPSKL